MIFAVDFDGTLCENKFPAIGKEIKRNTDFLRKYVQNSPHNEWILWTMREGDRLKEALEWLESIGLKPDAVNDNLDRLKAEWQNNPRKVYADFYLDDHNFTVPAEITSDEFENDKPAVMERPNTTGIKFGPNKPIEELLRQVKLEPEKIPKAYLDDAVNHPKHYTDTPFGLEVIEITDKYDFSVGNALKYILRAGKKGDAVEDLEKAVWYLKHKIELMKKNGSSVL